MTHFLQRTALIALATGALGACSTDEALTPNFPTRAPEASPPPAAPTQPAPTPPAPAPPPPVAVAPTAPVEEHPLEPPPARPPAAQAQAAPAPAPPAPTPAPAAAAPVPTYRSVTTRTVTGKVVEAEGRAVSYRVKKGDTLEDIADKLGTSVSQLREDNGLRKRSKIRPGQVLKGPRTRGRAYVAQGGDTLYSIGRRFGVTADALREENGLSRNAGLHPGERIRLPEGYRDRGPLTSTSRVQVSSGVQPIPAETEAPAEPQDETPAAPAPRSQPAPAVPAPAAAVPTYRSVTTRTVTGKVVEVEGRAVTYRVRKGDSLEKIARKLDTTVDQLREDNDLRRHEAIQPGQTLKGPRATAHAYVAGQGDTLYSIAKRFGVTEAALREENDLSRRGGPHTGEKLRLPEGYRDHGPLTSTARVLVNPSAVEAPVDSAPAAPPPPPPPVQSTPKPYTPPPYVPPAPRPYTPPPRSYAPPAAPAGPVAPPTPADEQISALGRGRFVWPLEGQIVSDFGPLATGQRNDGINISAAVGAPVVAAAAGDVVYAGDQVPGFGNLVLIKHPDGWVTAYGHLSRVLVKMQQKVAQGQDIGLAGATGGVAQPQLHFEIRYATSPLERAKPIDPKLVLPK